MFPDITEEAKQLWDWQHGGSSFYCMLYTLFQKADASNKQKLATAFPNHWLALEEWNKSPNYGEDFFKEWIK